MGSNLETFQADAKGRDDVLDAAGPILRCGKTKFGKYRWKTEHLVMALAVQPVDIWQCTTVRGNREAIP